MVDFPLDVGFMASTFFQVLAYLPVTLFLAAVSISAGLVIGFTGAVVQISRIPVLKQLSQLYVSFIRGTPMIAQLYMVYFGLPVFLVWLYGLAGLSFDVRSLPDMACALVAFSLNSGAFLIVLIRSALEAVEQSQWEACRAVGMTSLQAYWTVILPQAFRISIPLLGNMFSGIIKGTSLAFSVSVMEITSKAIVIGSEGLKFSESYLMVAVIYFITCKALETFFSVAETKLSAY